MFEDVILIAPIGKVWIGGTATDLAAARVALPNHHQLFGIIKRQRPQQHGVDDAEDGSVCADSQREGHNRDHAHARGLEHHANPVTDVLPERFHGRFLLLQLPIAVKLNRLLKRCRVIDSSDSSRY